VSEKNAYLGDETYACGENEDFVDGEKMNEGNRTIESEEDELYEYRTIN